MLLSVFFRGWIFILWLFSFIWWNMLRYLTISGNLSCFFTGIPVLSINLWLNPSTFYQTGLAVIILVNLRLFSINFWIFWSISGILGQLWTNFSESWQDLYNFYWSIETLIILPLIWSKFLKPFLIFWKPDHSATNLTKLFTPPHSFLSLSKSGRSSLSFHIPAVLSRICCRLLWLYLEIKWSTASRINSLKLFPLNIFAFLS